MEITFTKERGFEVDRHGNHVAHEGCDRCECGSKYWEKDICIDCGTTITGHLFFYYSVNGSDGSEF